MLTAQKTNILSVRTAKEMCSKKEKSKKQEKTSKFVGIVVYFLVRSHKQENFWNENQVIPTIYLLKKLKFYREPEESMKRG